MASAAEQLASSINLATFSKATELKKRLWFTLGALILFRLLSFVPLPGIDPRALNNLFQTTRGGVLDFFNMFSGGSLERMSLIALGIMPYITASIVVQLATSMSPTLAALKKEGETGRKKINQYTRYGTVFLCAIQGYFIAVGLEGWGAGQTGSAVVDPGLMFRITTVVSLVGGTMFLMWLGEQITSRGIGNGVSLIIMAGIVASLPSALANVFEGGRTGALSPLLILGVLALVAGLVLFICFMERAQRRVLIQYPKRQTARGAMQAERSHLPLKINTAGVIPPIFASSLLLFPATIASFQGGAGEPGWIQWISTYLGHGQPLYMALYMALIIFFAFFYTAVVFNPVETADNLKKYGGFVPGIRPGKPTAEYLDFILSRITLPGAMYLGLISVLPNFFFIWLDSSAYVNFPFGGTAVLIMVGVGLETVKQIESQLMQRNYEGFLR